MKLFLRRYPKVLEAMEHRCEMYNHQMEELDQREKDRTALILRPLEPLNIGHMEKNPNELERVYQIGRNEAGKRLDEIKEWLTE